MRWIASTEKDAASATLKKRRWDEYLGWLTQRLVKMDQVLRPVVKGLP